jgi:O-antigen ligase
MKFLQEINWRKIVYYVPLIFPLYLVKFEFGALPLNVLEIVILLMFLGYFVSWVYSAVRLWKKGIWSWDYFLKQNLRFFVLSLLFLIISIIAVVIVPAQTTLIDGEIIYQSRRVAFGILKGWIVVPYLYFVMLWFNTDRTSDLFTSIYTYVFSALPLVLWAFIQYGTGDFITLDGRASGPFINANYLAMYMAPAVAALWIMIVRGIILGFKVPRFVIGMVLAALYSVALLMTQSYGAILAVMFTLLLFLLLTFSIHRRFEKREELIILKKVGYFLGVFAVIAFMSAILLFANTQKWQMFTEIQARSSTSVRLQVYQISANFVAQSPLLGIGFGQFEPKYNLEAPVVLGFAPYEWVMIHPHNTFLAVWLNMGIAGLLLFVGLIVACFKRLVKNQDYEDQFFRLIGCSLLLVMLLHGLTDTYLFKNDLAMLFWLVVGLCILPHLKKVLESEAK